LSEAYYRSLKSICFSVLLVCVFAQFVFGRTNETRARTFRVAFIGFVGSMAKSDHEQMESALVDVIAKDSRAVLIEQSIVRPALTGVGYAGSINLTKDEARKIGAAIGCDFFLIGKAEEITRSVREGESHEEAFAGVMIVNGRTGALASFDFLSSKAGSKEEALQSLITRVQVRAAAYVDQMSEINQTPTKLGSINHQPSDRDSWELVEDIPEAESSRADGFNPPEFLNRMKPEYTSDAETADITATVEAMVVFGATGEIRGVEITRWAGFGLDESSARAIRQLKFKPATRDGAPINVRALIRYNFRRVVESGERSEPAKADKPVPDFRELFKPIYRRP